MKGTLMTLYHLCATWRILCGGFLTEGHIKGRVIIFPLFRWKGRRPFVYVLSGTEATKERRPKGRFQRFNAPSV